MDLTTLDLDVRPGTSILVAAPSLSPRKQELCADLATVAAPGAERVLSFTLVEEPERRAGVWLARFDDEPPCATAVVGVGTAQGMGAGTVDGSVGADGPTRVERVGFPPDLTELGVVTTNVLGDWEGADEQVVACFDSLSVLLQYADLRTASRFLQLLVGSLGTVDAVSHFHLDPGAHDERTVATVAQSFDVACRLTDDDEWAVTRR